MSGTTPGASERSLADRRPAIALFFSHGVGLETWESAGILDREAGYYRALSEHVGPVTFVTYDRGGAEFNRRATTASPHRVLHNDTMLPYRLFSLIAPFRHIRSLRRVDILKTNQFSGAWTAVIARWLTRKPLVVRGGFVRSLTLERQAGVSRWKAALGGYLEKRSVKAAQLVIAPTPAAKDYIIERHGIAPDKVAIVENPIDTEMFAPDSNARETIGRVVTVGRLAPEKNIDMLIEAISRVDGASLIAIGKGPERRKLEEAAAGRDVSMPGSIANSLIPPMIREAQVFALASSYEGSPKALLEAMACGKAVVGADSPGIREVIQHGDNGLLAEPTPDGFEMALRRLLRDSELRRRLGPRARAYVMQNNSQAASALKEARLLRELIGMRDSEGTDDG